MSKNETWRTRQYHQRVGGLLIEEFMVVSRSKNRGGRYLDGLIILGEPLQIRKGNKVNIEGKDIVILQTKESRLGMSLLGQAFFSRELMKIFKPKSIKTVAICGKSDEVLEKLAKKFEIEVVIIPDSLIGI